MKKKLVCLVSRENTRQSCHFAECPVETLGKVLTLPSVGGNTRQILTAWNSLPRFAEWNSLPSVRH
jgi:hypothetical protein